MSNPSDFVIENGVLKKYSGPGGDVVVPEGVISIGDSAFSGCTAMKSITIPEGVKSIGAFAFHNCESLEKITLRNPDIKIDQSAFYGCTELHPIMNGFKIIDNIIFDYRGQGGNITVPEGIRRVKSLSSARCVKITGINVSDINILPPKYRETAALTFAADGGTKEDPRYDSHCRYITQSARKLLSTAMKNRTLLSLMIREKLIPDKVVDDYIEAAQKTKDAGLISLMLEYKNENVTPEEREKLEKKKDKEQDTVIERQFARTGKEGIEGLNIAVTGDLETFKNRNEFKECITEKGARFATGISSRTDYLIMNDPNKSSEKYRRAKELGIEIVSERQFNVIMGREFIIKDNDIVRYVGPGGRVVVPEGIKYIRADAFHNCETVTEIVLPEGLKRIGNRSFAGCQNLLNINLPDGVTSIGEEAFFHCDSLTDLFIPRSVKKISGYFVFSACPKLMLHVEEGSFAENYAKENSRHYAIRNLMYSEPEKAETKEIKKSLTMAELRADWTFEKTKDGQGYVITDCKDTGRNVIVPDRIGKLPVVIISGMAFSEYKKIRGEGRFVNGWKSYTESVTLPMGLKEIDNSVFDGCSCLREVKFAEGLEKIGANAFYLCYQLENVTLPDSLLEIGERAFQFCSALSRITIPGNVRLIGQSAFASCREIKAFTVAEANKFFCSENGVLFDKDRKRLLSYPGSKTGAYVMPDSVKELDPYSFSGCKGLTSITFSSKLKYISKESFSNCLCLTEAVIPEGIEQIRYGSFCKCKELKKVYLPLSLKSIGVDAFAWCGDITIYAPSGSFAENYAKEQQMKFVAI